MTETLEYIVLCGQVVGNMGAGYRVTYGFDGERFTQRRKAIRHGFKVRGSDDFNIGVLKAGRLISLDWMYEPVDRDEAELSAISDEIFL